MKHTPGPWKCYDAFNLVKRPGTVCCTRIGNADGSVVVRGAHDNSDIVLTEADACLIASAPDLLQHLKYILMLASRLGPYASEVHREEALAMLEGTIRDAEEVIAKAEGKV